MGWARFIIITAALCSAAFSAVWFANGGPSGKASVIIPFSAPDTALKLPVDGERARFAICSRSPRINCIVDGDTFWYQGRKIRIADINTPEIGRPGCTREARLGEQAKLRLHHLLNNRPFSLKSVDRKRDRYGRELWVVTRGGESLGDTLVKEGLAHRWNGRRENWC
ncbi:MAG: thermonuclease family protein [Pseudomonadota bacterium]